MVILNLQQKLLEKETQHHMVTKELDHYKDQLRHVEALKAEAQRDLQRTNRSLQDLTTKLENLSESKQAAIKATEAAKRRAKELEQQQSLKAQAGTDAWRIDLDAERERYKASSGELILMKQELTNLRQDFDAALVAKVAAFQAIEDAEQCAKRNQERQNLLQREVSMLRQTLDQVKFDSLQAQEEHLKLVAEKEVHLLVHKSAREAAEREINCLRDEHGPDENLVHKLEETTEAIKVLQEQINDVRASDMHSLETAALELDRAKKELERVLEDEASLRASVDSLNLQLEMVRREHSECESNVLEQESRIEQMNVELEKMKAELISAGTSTSEIHEMEASMEKLLAEAERDRVEAEILHKEVELVRKEAEKSRKAAEETDEMLQIALQEAEEAKAAEKLADDKIHNSPGTDGDDLKTQGSMSSRRIRLSNHEFETMNHKIEQCRSYTDTKVGGLMAELQNIKSGELEVLKKVEMMLKEREDIQAEIEEVLKIAEMAEDAKKVVESELEKLRLELGDGDDVGEASEISEEKS